MKKNAFTIIELMIALFILSIGMSGSFILLRNISVASSISSSRLAATLLAREGTEVIRNIRDYNWAEDYRWDRSISELSSTKLQYDTSEFPDNRSLPTPCYLVVNPDSGFFECSSTGKFKRTITVEKEDLDGDSEPDKMHIVSKVEWSERSHHFEVYAVEDLYNWKQ